MPRVADLPVPVGAMVSIALGRGSGASIAGEVVGFDEDLTIVMPLGSTAGIRRGDQVTAEQSSAFVRVGESLLGRVLDGLGEPIDGKGPLFDTVARPLHPRPLDPLDRPLIDKPLATGVLALDALLSVGCGHAWACLPHPVWARARCWARWRGTPRRT